MSIDGNSTATSSKAVASVAGHNGKGKASSGDDADALAGSGFSALLTSFEPEVAADAAGTLALAEGAATGTQPEALDSRLPADERSPLDALPIATQSIPVTQDLPNDLAMLLAQAGEVAVARLSAEESSQMTALSAAVIAPAVPELPNHLPLLAQAGEIAVDKLDASPVEVKAGARLAAAAIGAGKPEIQATASALVATEAADEIRRHVDALREQAGQGLQARTMKGKGTELQSGAGAALAETRVLNQSFTANVWAREPVLSGALVNSGMGENLLRQVDRGAAKSSFSAAGSGVEGIWGQQAFYTGSRTDAPSAIASPNTGSLESMVADKVSYWVTQGVKNAELKLDGFGGEPLEVSISLKGSEAQINFRTDQPEIRQILEGAVAHLKDLLKSEGLVLSGVSVGTSGQDGAGTQERRNRPDTRQATITSVQAGPAESTQRISQSAGRAVDLFV